MNSAPTPSTRPLLQAEKLSKVYPLERKMFGAPPLVQAVDAVSLHVLRGETLGLVGESGCGKSTLGRTLLYLTEPTYGRVQFDGLDLDELRPRELRELRRRMQFVFQDARSALDPRLRVVDLVAEGLDIHGIAPDAGSRTRLVLEALEQVGLSPRHLRHFAQELSAGELQRVGLARSLVLQPELMVLDEPFSAQDLLMQARLLNLLGDLQDERQTSLVFISHDLRVVDFVSHRVAVMYLGRIVEVGPARELSKRRYHPYTRALYDAVPDRRRKERSLPLLGQPPSAIDPPTGCVFHPRCAHAEPGVCDVERPPLAEVVKRSHHRVACFHPQAS